MGVLDTATSTEHNQEEILRFIVEKERLTKTLKHFGITKPDLQELFFGPAKEEPPKEVIKKVSAAAEKKKAEPKTKKAAEKSTSESKKKASSTSDKAEEADTKKSTSKKSSSKRGTRRQSSPRGRRSAILEPEHYTYNRLLIYTDGAARGNPGESGAGVVLKTPEGEEVGRFGRYLGRTTNNQAEYQAVLLGLHHAEEFGANEVTILSDSDLMVRQLLGEYRVRAAHLREMFRQVKSGLSKFEKYQIKRILREKNSEADAMANRAIDERL